MPPDHLQVDHAHTGRRAAPVVFDAVGLRARRARWYATVRAHLGAVFAQDGSPLVTTEPDGRIAYWLQPALLSAPDEATRAWGRRIYARGAGWDRFDVFMTSQVAAHLARHREQLGADLVARSLAHLDAFALKDAGRSPSAAVYDYRFHGYNDNMPAMAVRTLLLAADALDRQDVREAGRFHLGTLVAHFHRRGLLSEHTSPTYTPIALCALLDVAECCRDPDDRALAQVCCDRILLDLLAHWHPGTGALGGTSMRSYTVDLTQTLSNWNAWWWHVSGDPLAIDPCVAVPDPDYPCPKHHARNLGFNLAQCTELMSADYAGIAPALRVWAAAPRAEVTNVLATSDWSASGAYGGAACLTRAHHRPAWFLATTSATVSGACAGQQCVAHAGWRTRTPARDWQDRAVLWPRVIADAPDHGEVTHLDQSPHVGSLAGADLAGFQAEADHVPDRGWYTTAQAGGSALLVGSPGPDLDGRTVRTLRFALVMRWGRHVPDEIVHNDQPCPTWEGDADVGWTCLRWGAVFVGLRLVGLDRGRRLLPKRVIRHGYPRLECSAWEETPRTVDTEGRRFIDFVAQIELADASTVDFPSFCRELTASRCEFANAFHREVRWQARGGTLHISDAPLRGTQRFIAVNGQVEATPRFHVDGLDPELLRLPAPPSGPLLLHGHAHTPFYAQHGQAFTL